MRTDDLQLDLFQASGTTETNDDSKQPREIKVYAENQVTENDLQAQHDKECREHHLTPRQWALLRLIKQNSFIGKRKTSQKEICDSLKDYGYEWKEKDANTNDNCSAIWNDIKEINLSYDTDKIIITKDNLYWIGSEEETQAFLDKLWNDLSPRLIRYWAYLKKAQRNGQGIFIDRKGNVIGEESQARNYIESYGKEKIDL